MEISSLFKLYTLSVKNLNEIKDNIPSSLPVIVCKENLNFDPIIDEFLFLVVSGPLNLKQIEPFKKAIVTIFYKDIELSEIYELSKSLRILSIHSLLDAKKLINSEIEKFQNQKNKFNLETWVDLNSFAARVSEIESIPDLLLELKHEFKRIKKITSPILMLGKTDKVAELFYFQGEKVRFTNINTSSSENLRIRNQSIDDRNLLAKALGRPVAKIMAVPIKARMPVTFYFENDLNHQEIEAFTNFALRRLQIIETVLDVLIIERQHNEASQLWETTFESISDPVAIIDENFQLLRGNKSFGKSKNLGSCFKVFDNRDEPCIGCPILSGSRQQQNVSEIRIKNQTFEVHSSAIYLSSKNEIAGYANHYVDQSENIKLKSRMIQSEKMAAIGHLAGNIAHELNNPLTGIRSISQILQRDKRCDSTLVADIKEIEKAAIRCQNIIINLLEYTKGQQSELLPFDLQTVVNKTLPLLKSAIRRLNVSLNFEELPAVAKVNEQLMQQVVFNLILNAAQALDGKGEIQVIVGSKEEKVFVKVADNGPGIPFEFQEHIFDPFFTTKKVGKGTGLGLSMVKKIVESFSGVILVESTIGKGTSMTILLPKVIS